MKKLFILTVIAAFFFAGCSDSPEDPNPNNNNTNGDPIANLVVPETNTSLVVKFSGTNCPPCGGWGWGAFSEIIAGTSDNSVHLIAYSSNFVAEHFITPEATALDDAQSITGYPSFSVNDVPRLDRPNGSVNVTNEKKMCIDAAAAHAAAPVEMSAAISYEIKDGKIHIYYKVKAFKDMPEDNYFAIYVLEDKVKQYQAGYPDANNAIHKHVLRKGVDGAWGIQLGAMTSGQVVTGTKEVTINEDYSTGLTWNEDNIEVIGIMRYEVSSVKVFVNACEGKKI